MSETKKYTLAIKYVVEEQGKVIGKDLAYELANTVDGLKFTDDDVLVSGNPLKVLETLVEKYSILFGKISVEVSKDAIDHAHINDSELPKSLQ